MPSPRLHRAVCLGLVPLLGVVVAGAALDTSSNKLSDVWEAVHGASGLVAAGDPDGDVVNNADEAIAGTDPLDPFLQPRLELSGGGALLTPAWAGFAGKRYQLLAADSLLTPPAEWQVLADVASAGGAHVHPVVFSGLARF